MSAQYSISSLLRITPVKLAERVRAKDPSLAVIDVRDSDYIGGHIAGGMNIPTNTHDYAMPELVRKLADKDTVVFHCALSQQRGPSSALRYLRERNRLLGSSAKEQTVCVLEGGFVKWQEAGYGEDTALTEDYKADIWEFGY